MGPREAARGRGCQAVVQGLKADPRLQYRPGGAGASPMFVAAGATTPAAAAPAPPEVLAAVELCVEQIRTRAALGSRLTVAQLLDALREREPAGGYVVAGAPVRGDADVFHKSAHTAAVRPARQLRERAERRRQAGEAVRAERRCRLARARLPRRRGCCLGRCIASAAAPITADRGASRTNAAPATPQQRRQQPPPYMPPASNGVADAPATPTSTCGPASAPAPLTSEEIACILPAFWR